MNKNHFLLMGKILDSDCLTRSLNFVFTKKLVLKTVVFLCDNIYLFKGRNFSISEIQRNIIKSPV